ncbi:hypothetical protein EV702DRAFT_1041794 [Suillus placidus]|uniref:Uncharacterized protein n=1 Tax=Suillus placidus TaxID=48579 RepID=A0A9P7A4H1_9AGAM|nr:hypothetical protein EV702DRAFT_1041794 [Suillus placidus]
MYCRGSSKPSMIPTVSFQLPTPQKRENTAVWLDNGLMYSYSRINLDNVLKIAIYFNGVSYPFFDGDEIPAGYAQVDVTLRWEIGKKEYPTSLTAGSVGRRIYSSGDKTLSDDGERDSARPALG